MEYLFIFGAMAAEAAIIAIIVGIYVRRQIKKDFKNQDLYMEEFLSTAISTLVVIDNKVCQLEVLKTKKVSPLSPKKKKKSRSK